jgi:hypothetical protein
MYLSHIEKSSSPDTAIFLNKAVVDTIQGISYAHSISPSIGLSASPKIYGMFQSTNPNSYLAAIRHVITPSASFSFTPDMSDLMPNYYHTIATPNTITGQAKTEEYSIYENYIYGTPVIRGRSGSLSLGLNNNLEMKVRPKNDTTGKPKNVSILDNLNFSTSYSPFAKDFRWAPMNMTGSTRLFAQKLNFRFGASFDPYALDTLGHRIDRYLINEKGKLFRTTRGYVDFSFGFRSKSGDKARSGEETMSENGLDSEYNPDLSSSDETDGLYYGDYVDYSIPWSINLDYSWSYSKTAFKPSYTHTVRISGDISLTPKWKIGGNTGYDFVARKITTTNFSINRDLHCWQMSFSVIPFGDRQSYSFSLNAKSSILRDVKYDKRKSWYDNF